MTDETKGMIGAEQIARMPRGSVLVNCARGALLDYEAVCDASTRANSPEPPSTSTRQNPSPPTPAS